MTTYYFIRHAEKERNGSRDPHLTSEGKRQAEKWREILSPLNIDLVYCTPLRRTQETAQPLLDKLHFDFHLYDSTDLFNERFQKETKEKTTLVVGHQDTTPLFVNRILKKRKYAYIPNHHHGNLYRVKIHQKGAISARLHHIDL